MTELDEIALKLHMNVAVQMLLRYGDVAVKGDKVSWLNSTYKKLPSKDALEALEKIGLRCDVLEDGTKIYKLKHERTYDKRLSDF